MSIARAVEAIGEGLVVGLPTDTVYGLAIDPNNEEAVATLYKIKGRPAGKPIGLLVASNEQAQSVGVITESARLLAERHWPGGLTLVVMPRVIMADWVGDQQRRTIGLRMPDHPVALELLNTTGPLAVTSANRSGEPEVTDEVAAEALFGDAVAVYLPGLSPGGVPSTVVDATTEKLTVLRHGALDVAGTT